MALSGNDSSRPEKEIRLERLPMNKQTGRMSIARRAGAVLIFGLSLGLLMILSFGGPTRVVYAGGGTPVPTPNPTPTPQPPAGSVLVTSVSKVIHNLMFDSSKISEALGRVFVQAAQNNEQSRQAEVQKWGMALGDFIRAPAKNSYSAVARSSLKVAGSLAVALFILRLAMYQWNKLLGSDDSPLQVIGDWLTGGVLAVASGPFLDMIVRLGWWTMTAVLGETAGLAGEFVQSMAAPSFINSAIASLIPGGQMIQAIVGIALGIGSLLALAAMLFAFGVAQATLFSLAALGPGVAVASVIPEMKWLRSLWIKGAVLVSIMPIMAGGIFKAGIGVSAGTVGMGGIMSGVFRVLWLFGAAGLLLSTTGVLFRITLGAAGEALGKMWGVAKGIVGTVALVGAAAATGGVAAAAGGGVATAGSAAGAGGGGTAAASAAAGGSSMPALGGGGSASSAMNSLNQASTMNTMSNIFSGMGLPNQARMAGGLARGHELEARKASLADRVSNFGAGSQSRNEQEDLGIQGLSPRATQALLENFGGSAEELKQVFPAIGNKLADAGFPSVGVVVNHYPGELGAMARLYRADPDRYNSTPDMLYSLAQDATATGMQGILKGRPR
jgi:hypothetical protein